MSAVHKADTYCQGTATAPLDRLKVYLIANVSPTASAAAAKNGDVVGAAKQVGGPIKAACIELWKAGGIRSLFAGAYNSSFRT